MNLENMKRIILNALKKEKKREEQEMKRKNKDHLNVCGKEKE